MVLVAVYSSVRDQPKEMETRAGSLLESLFQNRVTRQLTVLNRFVDPGKVLIDDAACAEIQMADFGISHLTIGETDIHTTGAQAAAGVGLIEVVVERRFP
jgi:hypothetical protein